MFRYLLLTACSTVCLSAMSVDELVGTWTVDVDATKAATKPNEMPPPGAKPETIFGKVKLAVTKETLTYTDWGGKNHAIPASALKSTGDHGATVNLAALAADVPKMGPALGILTFTHAGDHLTIADSSPGKPPFAKMVVLKKGG